MKAGQNKQLVLAAMVFAVAMTFIDQTIVAIAIPSIQRHVHLTATGSQWVINGYLVALSALFAFGGRLGDIVGRRRMVTIGVVGFAAASAMCGLTPTGSIGETWLITFRVLQGASAAIMFPSAVGVVVSAFPFAERGKAMATFFGISGALTAIGPIAGGYLTQYTWRSIFWINVPVAAIALFLIWRSKPANEPHPAKLDPAGAILISAAMGLIVLGLQQAAVWGWGNPATIGVIVLGIVLFGLFLRSESRSEEPLLRLSMFKDRGFSAETAVLGLMSVVFVPFFFFASIYSQVSLGKGASDSGFYIMYFFIGFVIAAQIGGRILDERGARPAVVLGAALGAVGFFLLAGKVTDLSLNAQWMYIALAGAGPGLMLGVASTDAVNRAPSSNYSEVTGITQTARNFGGALGLAVLGSILVSRNLTNIGGALTKAGVPSGVAHRVASQFGTSGGGGGSRSSAGQPHALIHDVQVAFAHSTQTVFYVMAGVMVVTFLVALRWVPAGRVAAPEIAEAAPAGVEPERVAETPFA